MKPKTLPEAQAEIIRLRDVIRRLMTNPYLDLGDCIYQVREREGYGWDGPAVKRWGLAVADAQNVLREEDP